jgi:hypothetical protein
MSNLTPLWQPGLALLARLGLRRPVERAGRRLDTLESQRINRCWFAPDDADPSLIAVPTGTVESVLDRQVRNRLRTADQPVTELCSTDTGVSVTFEGGVEEQFDAAVSTSHGPLPTANRPRPAGTIHAWTFEWPSCPDPPLAVTEAWESEAAVIATPAVTGAEGTILIAPAAAPADPLDSDAVASVLAERFPSLPNHIPELANTELSYRRVGVAAPVSIQHGHVVLAGRGARASRPGGLLGPALGLEDAWVLADELAFGPTAVQRALRGYESRRRDRGKSLQQALQRAGVSRPSPVQLAPVLAGLWRSRALAFSHVLGDPAEYSGRTAPAEL